MTLLLADDPVVDAPPQLPVAWWRQQLLKAARPLWAPPTQRTVSEFADAEIVVASGPMTGTRWQTSFAPYQRGILDAVHEGKQFVVIMGSSQWGKTACAVNIAAYHMAHDPCEIMVVEPNEVPMGRDFVRNRLEPTIRSSPALHEVVDRRRQKDASNTTMLKTFRGGFIAVASAQSPAALAARSIRLLILDEIERYERQLKGEGDTLEIAIKRTQTFQDRKRIIMLSSPKLSDGPIHSWWKRGDQRRYYVPCPGCGVMHPFEWKNVHWNQETRDPSTARLHCPDCDYAIDEAERVAILQHGEWRAENDDPQRDRSIVSFHLWEAYSPMSSLTDIVSGFLRARAAQKTGDKGPMQTWQNTTLGEPVEPDRGEGVEPEGLLMRRESFGPEDVDLPMGVCCLTAGVDTQDDRLELLVVGWGIGEESWVVLRQAFPGDTSSAEPWDELDLALTQDFRHASGRRMPIRAVAIDTGGHRASMVYHFVAPRAARRIYAIKGSNSADAPIVTSPSDRRFGQGERQVPLYFIGTSASKALLTSRLKLTRESPDEPSPGYIHLPLSLWCDEEFVAQLTSERFKTRFERGQKIEEWVKTRPRNEGLDCYLYALGAFYQQQPDQKRRHDWLVQLAVELRDGPAPPPPTTPAPTRPGWIQPRQGGWLRGGR